MPFIAVCLDPLDTTQRSSRASELIDWLTATDIIAPVAESLWPKPGFGIGAWGPGIRWTSAVDLPISEPWLTSPGEHVDISTERCVYSALENFADFTCTRCSTPLASDLGELIDIWFDGTEPFATCKSCGWTALLGDWPSDYPPGLVGGLAVSFERWPPLRRPFLDELGLKLGERCRMFWAHS